MATANPSRIVARITSLVLTASTLTACPTQAKDKREPDDAAEKDAEDSSGQAPAPGMTS